MSEEITKDFKRIAPKRWKRYPRYKDSGVEWIGEIPTNWRVYRLKELARMNPSKTEKNHLPDDLEVSFVPMESIGEYGGISGAEAKKLLDVKQGYTYFAEGDLIVAKITPCFENYKGAIATDLVNGIGFGTTELFVLRPNERSDSRYLFYVSISKAFRETGSKIMHGAAGQKRITVDFINNYPVALPKPEEQSQIVGFLDETLKRVDSLITKKQRLIKLLKEKRAAIIARAVTKGLNPNAPMKDSGVEWIGEMPKHWNIGLIKQGYQVTLGKMLQPNKRSENDFEAPYLRSANIQDGFVDTSEIKTMYFNKSEDHLLLEEGDLLVCEGGDVGRAAIWSNQVSNCRFQNSINRIRSKTNSVRYLFYLLKASKRSGFIDFLCNRATISHFTAEKVKGLRIVYPDMTEQLKIANYLDKETSRMNSFISKIEKSIELLKEYRSALITAAVTGKIDVREEVP